MRIAATGIVLVAAVLLSCGALRNQFGNTSLTEVRKAIHAQPAWHLLGAVALTAVSFLALAMIDFLGVSVVVPRRVPVGVALLAGSTADAISNTLGFPALTGSLVRARIYLKFGLTRAEVARIVSITWLTLALGVLSVLASAELMRTFVRARDMVSLGIGLSGAALLLLFVGWLARGERQITVFGFRQPMPSRRMALVLMGTGSVETAAAFGALYILLPPDLAPPFGLFAVGCIAAVSLGLAAHVPGGVGVFEAAVTAMLSGAHRADLLAALLLYRLIYNILPFAVSVVALGLFSRVQRDEIATRKHLS